MTFLTSQGCFEAIRKERVFGSIGVLLAFISAERMRAEDEEEGDNRPPAGFGGAG